MSSLKLVIFINFLSQFLILLTKYVKILWFNEDKQIWELIFIYCGLFVLNLVVFLCCKSPEEVQRWNLAET